MVFIIFIFILVCVWYWRNRKKKIEGIYDLFYWDWVGWWKGMKQFFFVKVVDYEEILVCYSSSEVNYLSLREVIIVLQVDFVEYVQLLVGGIVGIFY